MDGGECRLDGERANKITPRQSGIRRCGASPIAELTGARRCCCSFTDPVRTVREETMNLGSVPGFDLRGAASDRGRCCSAPARRGALWPCRGRALALTLALLAVVTASAGGWPVLAATQPAANL